MKEVSLCFIGAGKIASDHLGAFSRISGVRLSGICSRTGKGLEELSRNFSVSETFTDYKKMLDDMQPDGVVIQVAHEHTSEVAHVCLERGIPCLIEKPPALSVEGVMRLCRIAETTKTPHMVGFNRRFYSSINFAKEKITSFGPLMGIQVECPEPIKRKRKEGRLSEELYDNWFYVNSIHAVDLLRFLGGEVSDVYSLVENWEEKDADSFVSSLRFKNGALGSYLSFWQSSGFPRVVVYGKGVRAVLINFEQGSLIFEDETKEEITFSEEDTICKPGFLAQAKAFVRLVRGEGSDAKASDLFDSLKSMELAEKIYSGTKAR